jgi:hypothetical protein
MSLRKVVRRIFGSKRKEVTLGWRKMRADIHNLYPEADVITIVYRDG